MSIENNELPQNPTIESETVKPFRRFCTTIMTIGSLPSSYQEAMSYQEMLLWLCDFIENKVIPAFDNNANAITELQNLYVELKDYVDNYFTNLDVQEEINNKLDELVENGTLTNLINPYLNYLDERLNNQDELINTKFNEQNNLINNELTEQDAKIQSLTNFSPIPVSSIDDMSDTSKVYLNTTDGYWYYYNGTQWSIGEKYQTPEDSQTLENLDNQVNNINNDLYNQQYDDITSSLELIEGKFIIVDGNESHNGNVSNWKYGQYTQPFKVYPGDKFKITARSNANSPIVVYFNTDTVGNANYVGYFGDNTQRVDYVDEEVTVPKGVSFMVVNNSFPTQYTMVVKKFNAQGSLKISQNDIDNIDYYIKNIQKTYNNSYIFNNFKWKQFDKAYITIRVDDCRHDMDLVANIMKSYNFPLSVSAIATKINNEVDGITDTSQKIGTTVLDVLKYVNNNNGEILNHPAKAINDSNDNTIYDYFIAPKITMENNNIEMTGTTVADTFPTDNVAKQIQDKISLFYQYSDGYGVLPQYKIGNRLMIGTNAIQTTKYRIDDAVTNHKNLNLIFHTLDGTEGTSQFENGFNQELFKEILNYIQTYVNNNQAVVITYKSLFDNFGSFILPEN